MRHASTAALLAFIIAGSVILAWPATPSARIAVAATAERPAAPPVHFYDQQLAQLDRRIELVAEVVQAQPKSWLRKSELANLLMERGQLRDALEDHAWADRLIDEAIALGPNMMNLRQLRADLDFTLHRFDRVARQLDVPEKRARADGDARALAGILAMRGSLAFERGAQDEAERLLLAAVELDKSYGALARLAHLRQKSCRFDEASALFDAAADQLPAFQSRARAWLSMQRGLMSLDRGRYDEALVHYRSADATYPGWWLVHEQIAHIEVLARGDETATSADDDEADARIDAETAAFEAQLARFPEATYGHALGHFLGLHGVDPRAVALAQKNFALRPGPLARTQLGQALLEAGRAREALAVMLPIAGASPSGDNPWCSAETEATLALVQRALGDRSAAQRAEDRSRAINPDALRDLSWLAHDVHGHAAGLRSHGHAHGVSRAR